MTNIKSPVAGITFCHPAQIEIAAKIEALTEETNKLLPERDALYKSGQIDSTRFFVVDLLFDALCQESIKLQRELRTVSDAIYAETLRGV